MKSIKPKTRKLEIPGKDAEVLRVGKEPFILPRLKKVGPLWGRYIRPIKMEKHEGRLG